MISDIKIDSALGMASPYCPPMARYCLLKKGQIIIEGMKAVVDIPMLSVQVVKV